MSINDYCLLLHIGGIGFDIEVNIMRIDAEAWKELSWLLLEWGLLEWILSQRCMFPQWWRDTVGVGSCWENKGAPTLPFLSWQLNFYLIVECSWNKSLSLHCFSHFSLHHMMVSVHKWGSSLIKLNYRTYILCVLATWQVVSSPDQVRFCLKYGPLKCMQSKS